MSEVGSLVVSLKGDGSGLSRAAAQAKRDLSGIGSQAQQTGGILKTAIGTAFGFAGATIAMAGLGNAVGFVGNAVIGFNSRLEQARIGFTTMLGSAKAADTFIADMKTFANKTPFTFPGLQASAQRMLAMGFSAQEVLPKLTSVGDAVAALGGNEEMLNRVTYAMGQMKTAGRVNAQDMMQLTSAGIPAWQMLADAIGKSVGETRKLAENGLIPAEQAIEAITAGMDAKFGGMMQRQSRTFQGAMSTISDSLNGALASAFEPFFAQISKGADALGQFTSSTEFQAWAAGIGKSLGSVAAAAARLVGQVVPVVTSLVRTFSTGLGPALGTNAKLIADFVGKLIGIGVAFAKEVAPAIGGIMGKLAALGGAILKDVGPAVLSFAQSFANFAAVIIKNVIPVIIDLARRIWDGGLGKAVKAVIEVLGFFLGVLGKIVAWITSNKTLMMILSTVADAIGASFSVLAGIIGAIPDAATAVFGAVARIGASIANVFVGAINLLIDAYNALPFGDIGRLSQVVVDAGAAVETVNRAVARGGEGARQLDVINEKFTAQKAAATEAAAAQQKLTAETTKGTSAAAGYKIELAGVGNAASGASSRLKDMASAAKDKLGAAFDAVKERARTFFDKLHADNLRAITDARDLANATLDAQAKALQAPIDAARKALQDKQDADQEAQLRQSVSQAQDPEAMASAQRALDDFLAQQSINRMQAAADEQLALIAIERKANDDRAAEQEKAETARYNAQVAGFDKQLAALQKSLIEQPKAWRTANERVLALLDAYGVDYAASGSNLGASFAAGLRREAKTVESAAKSLAAAAAAQLRVKSPTERGPLSEDQSKWGARLASNWVAGLQLGLGQGITIPGLGGIAAMMQARPSGGAPSAPQAAAPAAGRGPLMGDVVINVGTMIASEGEQRAFARLLKTRLEDELWRTGQPSLLAARGGR